MSHCLSSTRSLYHSYIFILKSSLHWLIWFHQTQRASNFIQINLSADFVLCKWSKMFSAFIYCYYKSCPWFVYILYAHTHHSYLWFVFCFYLGVISIEFVKIWGGSYFYVRWIRDNFFGLEFFWLISELDRRSKVGLKFKDFLFARIWFLLQFLVREKFHVFGVNFTPLNTGNVDSFDKVWEIIFGVEILSNSQKKKKKGEMEYRIWYYIWKSSSDLVRFKKWVLAL